MLLKLVVSIFVVFFAYQAIADSFNVSEICEGSVHRQFSNYVRDELHASPALMKKTPQEIADEIVLYTAEPEALPWFMQDVSDPKALKAAYLVQMRLAQPMIDDFYPGMTPKEIFERAVRQPTVYTPEAVAQSQIVLQSILNSPPADADSLNQVKQNSVALCLPYFSLDCSGALGAALDLMNVHEVSNAYIIMPTNVSRPDAIAKLLTEPTLVQGFSYFALQLIENVESGKAVGSSLFDDLQASFLKFGVSPAQAEENTWTILTFYSTRGASLAMFNGAANRENLPALLGEYVLSTAIGIIDEKTVGQGHAYSYPTEISGFCKMDRPYHFWMASSLVRDLMKQGYSAKAAAAATHILGKLYEFGAQVNGRDATAIYRGDYLSDYNQMVRIGTAYKTAGELWASKLNKKSLDFDDALMAILTKSRPITPKTDKQIADASQTQKYVWFNQIIAPDAALSSFGPF